MTLSFTGSYWQNSNLQIEAWIAGKAHTVWEKYRLLCNQLENRKSALTAVLASGKRVEAKLAKYEHLQIQGTKWEQLEAEADLLEIQANKEVSDRCIKDAQQEVAFIESLILALEDELEESRIPGCSDSEMFQEVQEEEWRRELLHRAENNYISRIFGGFPPEQIDAMRSHPQFDKVILPSLQAMHQDYMPAISAANTLPMPSNNGQKILARGAD